MNLADLHAQLDDLPMELSKVDRDTLVNEGYREIVTASGWTQKQTDVGPTVSSQESYAGPTDMHEPLDLRVGTSPYRREQNRARFREVAQGRVSPRAYGVWNVQRVTAGAVNIRLAPTPTSGGASVLLSYTYQPADLSASSDTPLLPEAFHRGIVDYAKAQAYSGLEGAENPDLAGYHAARYQAVIEALRRLRVTQTGEDQRDLMQMQAQEAAAS
jgi:hypothetical protein